MYRRHQNSELIDLSFEGVDLKSPLSMSKIIDNERLYQVQF